MSDDCLVRALIGEGLARALWIDASDTVARMVSLHGLEAGAADLGAQLVVANLLMSAWLKGDERVSLQLQAERPKGSFMGEVDAEGRFRGWFAPAHVPRTTRVDGILLAIKSDRSREMYRGMTAVEGEPLERALDRHLRQSDQVDVVLRLEVTGGRALGLLLERIPGQDDEEEHHARFLQAFAPLRGAPLGGLGDALEAGALLGETARVLERREVRFECRCSAERVETMLVGLGRAQLEEMIAEDGGAEVRCHFCEAVYAFDAAQLGVLAARSG